MDILLQFVLPCLAVCVAMAHCAAIDEKAESSQAEDAGKTVEKRGLHLGDYHHHHEHIKTVTIEKKVPVPYTVTKHVPYTVEKKVRQLDQMIRSWSIHRFIRFARSHTR